MPHARLYFAYILWWTPKHFIEVLNITFWFACCLVLKKLPHLCLIFICVLVCFLFAWSVPLPSCGFATPTKPSLPPLAAPSAPPQEVHLVSLSSTSLKVSWVAPPAASRHGAIVRYTVSYQALAGEDTERHEVTGIGAEAISYVLEGLEKWTEYQVWVRAHTDVGPGPESAPVRMKTKEDGRWTDSSPGDQRSQSLCLCYMVPLSLLFLPLPTASTDHFSPCSCWLVMT